MSNLQLSADLGIESVDALKQQLLPLLKKKSAIRLDGTQVSRLHSGAVQVLCAFFAQRAAAKLPTELSASDELRSAATVMGVDHLIGLN
ncbi:MAG TPA: STAS domain-containing protein [Aquimonas sp.]|jgi:ABC-type transporter Mla MlaB component|nr:STAS domain-containing protein [Xanthomonadales bacterium]HRD74122.1 STAS domain-containing protein [Aquimonas sp.]HRF55210.1 STAS domain-containing protein [Aquimonas sp.]